MVGGEQPDYGSGSGFVGKCLQSLRDGGDEAAIRAAQHEEQLGCRFELRVGGAGVVERPGAELFRELA